MMLIYTRELHPCAKGDWSKYLLGRILALKSVVMLWDDMAVQTLVKKNREMIQY